MCLITQWLRVFPLSNIIIKNGISHWEISVVIVITVSSKAVCMVCMLTYIASVWINRIRLQILLVVSRTGKINISLPPFVPENLISRDGFGSPVPRQPAHLNTQARCLLTGLLPSSATASIYLFKPPYAIGSVPSVSGHAIVHRWRSLPRVCRHRASKPQGNSKRVLPCLAGHHGPNTTRLSFPHPLLV